METYYVTRMGPRTLGISIHSISNNFGAINTSILQMRKMRLSKLR